MLQQFHLLPTLTAMQNLLVAQTIAGLHANRAAAHSMLNALGVDERVDAYPHELSIGQQQRVAIARAIVADPRIIVADEPTGDLDRKSAEEVLGLLRTLNETLGKTVLMVTHDPHAAEAAKVRRRLDKGQLT